MVETRNADTRAIELRVTPLESMSHRLVAASSLQLALAELPHQTQITLRGNPSSAPFRKAVKTATGAELPREACTVNVAGDNRVLWLGPDEWLAVAPDDPDGTLLGKLEKGLAKQSAVAVDVGSNRTIIEISGIDARALLEKACLHDLHPAAFPVNRVVGTLIAKCQVFLEKTDDRPDTFRLYVRSSFARHLAEWLIDAAAEFSEQVV